MIEYALKMATGDPSVPKGGDPSYRSGEWYKTCFGKEQGDFMTEDNAKDYGHGVRADEPYRFITIERKMTALRKWYDEVLKEEMIANRGLTAGAACEGSVFLKRIPPLGPPRIAT